MLALAQPPSEVTAWLVFFITLATALGLLPKVWARALEPVIRRVILEVLDPELARMKRLETTVNTELTLNGGASMKDALRRIEASLAGVDEKITELAVRATNTETALASHHGWSQRAVAEVNADRAARGLEALPGDAS